MSSFAPFHRLTDDFFAAPQLAEADLDHAKAQGFTTILCNRPDGEAPGQPTIDAMQAAAVALGLAFHAIPMGQGGLGQEDIAAAQQIIAAGEKTLAYCRTGTRSSILHAFASAASGQPVEEILSRAQTAGYDLSGMASQIAALSPKGD